MTDESDARREELARKLDSIRPDGSSNRPLEPEDVTGVMELALERVRVSMEQQSAALGGAADRLMLEAAATRVLSQRLSLLPPEPEEDEP